VTALEEGGDACGSVKFGANDFWEFGFIRVGLSGGTRSLKIAVKQDAEKQK
jgi:hypothetical protein